MFEGWNVLIDRTRYNTQGQTHPYRLSPSEGSQNTLGFVRRGQDNFRFDVTPGEGLLLETDSLKYHIYIYMSILKGNM